ncbi:Cu/Ag efflux protein CusF [Amorphus suaedae]
MKTIGRMIAVAAFLGLTVSAGVAAEYTKGVVQKVDAKLNKLTIKHEELKNLDMPAMTMVFVVADPGMIAEVQEGDAVEFVVERLRGKLTIVELK